MNELKDFDVDEIELELIRRKSKLQNYTDEQLKEELEKRKLKFVDYDNHFVRDFQSEIHDILYNTNDDDRAYLIYKETLMFIYGQDVFENNPDLL